MSGHHKVLPGGHTEITCETLDDALRVAYLAVAHTHSCELIVRDARHRVLEHEPIAGRRARVDGPIGDEHDVCEERLQTAVAAGPGRCAAVRAWRSAPDRR